jgi:S1-C subfamily serine protease
VGGECDLEIVTQDKKDSPLATGIGFFISNDGKLVTNRHVVEGAAGIVAKTEQGSFFVCKGVLAEPKDADILTPRRRKLQTP